MKKTTTLLGILLVCMHLFAYENLMIFDVHNSSHGCRGYRLWLWIAGEPIEADIYERWTASLIYEQSV